MSKIGRLFHSIASGEFLLTLGLDRYIIHVIYTFLLFMATIWIGIQIEKTFIKVESNKAVINELKVESNKLNFQLEQMNNSNTLEQRLKQMGSDLRYPEKPATRIR